MNNYVMQTDKLANGVEPDQKQSDLGLHCLPRSICPNIITFRYILIV